MLACLHGTARLNSWVFQHACIFPEYSLFISNLVIEQIEAIGEPVMGKTQQSFR